MRIEKRTLLTIEDLLKFCQENKLYNFNSNEQGYKLSVQVPAAFEVDENVDDAHRGMLKLKFRIFHTGLNRNGSFVSEEAAKAAMPTIKNRPVLAAIHQLDNGEWDFEAHNFEIVKNEDGTEEINYIEKQVGSFDESDPFFEYDKDLDKTYICSYAYIPEEYTKAADIIRRKNGTKNSCELSIEQFSYNAKENYLNLEAFYVAASTLLGAHADGTEIGEGMLGSRADIADFSEQNNSMQFSINEELLNEIKKLNENLSRFNIDSKPQKGGKTVKFEELLEKYGKTVEDITFEYENLSDEELEAKFAEVFGEENTDGEGADPEPASDGDEGNDNSGDEGSFDDGNSGEGSNEGSDEGNPEGEQFSDKLVRTFEISHEDVRYALYNLLSSYEEADDEWYYITSVYDTHFAYENWRGDKIFGQAYTKNGDNVSFDGERYSLHRELLTDSEYAELQSMRSNYSVIKSQLEAYQIKEEDAQKDALFVSEDYSSISDKEEFKALAENHAEFSVDELKNKLDAIILDYAKRGNLNFSVESEVKKIGMTRLPIQTNKNKKSRYGSIFSK